MSDRNKRPPLCPPVTRERKMYLLQRNLEHIKKLCGWGGFYSRIADSLILREWGDNNFVPGPLTLSEGPA